MNANVIEKQDYKQIEKSILEATREFEAKLRALQPDVKLHISLSGIETPQPGCMYYLADDSAAKITIYDKNHMPF